MKLAAEQIVKVREIERCMKILAKAMKLHNDYVPMSTFNILKAARLKIINSGVEAVGEMDSIIASF
ncbi:MAG: hypothetical protein COB24_09160 [Hyphomicrobiales bacterium]|nr:MAG: hypothetical protein COB24_09160 [Hyphomicrobiales bacterium]